MCVCVCVCVCDGSEKFGGRDYSSDVRPLYILYFVLRVCDPINKWTHSKSSSWRGRSRGSSSWSGHNRTLRSDYVRLVPACLRHYCTRPLVRQSRGLCPTHTDMVKEVRPQKHNYICSEERTVVHHAVLTQTEVGAPPISALWKAAGAGLLT